MLRVYVWRKSHQTRKKNPQAYFSSSLTIEHHHHHHLGLLKQKYMKREKGKEYQSLHAFQQIHSHLFFIFTSWLLHFLSVLNQPIFVNLMHQALLPLHQYFHKNIKITRSKAFQFYLLTYIKTTKHFRNKYKKTIPLANKI